jgi:FkbM family methyltransferase
MQATIVEVQGILVDAGWQKFHDAIRRSLRKGQYEACEAKAADLLVREGDTVVEVGGGCGFLSAFIAKLNRAARIISVEADPQLIPVMEHTHSLNDVSVEIFNEVLSDTSGWTDFYVCDKFWVSSCQPPEHNQYQRVTVPTASFQARIAEWQPNLLIVDIEGGERELFQQPLAPCVDRIILELHEWAYGSSGVDEVLGRLSDLGFSCVPSASMGQVLSYQRLSA